MRLLVYVNGSAIGAEDSAIKRTPEGWLITGTGRLSPPLDLTTRRFSVRYSADWKPAELVIEATSRGAAFSVHTTFDGTVAENDVVQLGQPSHKRDTVSPDTLVLPNLFFAGDEALAMRLAAMPGDAGAFAAYIAPQAEIKLEARRLDVQTIETARGTVPRPPLRGQLLQPWCDAPNRSMDRRQRPVDALRSPVAGARRDSRGHFLCDGAPPEHRPCRRSVNHDPGKRLQSRGHGQPAEGSA